MRWLIACVPLLGLASCGAGAPDNVPVSESLMRLVPPDTVFLAGASADDLRQTAAYDRLLAAGLPSPVEDFFDGMGLDPATDLHEVLFAHDGARGVLMVRANLTGVKLDQPDTARSDYRGRTLLEGSDGAVLLWDDGVALLGSAEMLRSMADNHDSYTGIPEPIRQRLDAIEYGNQVWAVSVGGGIVPTEAQGAAGNLMALAQRAGAITLSASFLRGLSMVIHAECSNREDAESLEAAVRTVLALARLGLRDRPATGALLESLALQRSEQDVEITADLAPELLNQFLQELPAGSQR